MHGASGFDGQTKFLRLFDDKNNFFAEFTAKKGSTDELGVFVAVADEKTFGVAMMGEASEEFWFASDFESEVVWFARIENFLYDFAHLVDLDWENTAVGTFIAGGFDSIGKSLIDGTDAVAEEIVETNEKRVVQAFLTSTGGNFNKINASTVCGLGMNRHVSCGIDAEITASPTSNSVGTNCFVDGPFR